MFYDCHTYSSVLEKEVRSIINYKSGENLLTDSYYSIGIHPWQAATDDFEMSSFETVAQYGNDKNIVAIGECGLDKLHDNFTLQKQVFIRHVALANQVNKPLIVHCVKAHSDMLSILDTAKVPVIIHGINNKIDTLKPFLKHTCFFSFGAAILKQKSIARKTILDIPVELLLLETDDSEIAIQEIYQESAKLKNIPIDEFTLRIEKNIKAVFKWQ